MLSTRKLAGTALLLAFLVCTMGASSIAFDAGQPVPNPGGVLSKLEGKGTFVVDPNETFFSIILHSKEVNTKQFASKLANSDATAKTWDGSLDLVKGKYEIWGSMTTADKNNLPIFTKTKVETKNVN